GSRDVFLVLYRARKCCVDRSSNRRGSARSTMAASGGSGATAGYQSAGRSSVDCLNSEEDRIAGKYGEQNFKSDNSRESTAGRRSFSLRNAGPGNQTGTAGGRYCSDIDGSCAGQHMRSDFVVLEYRGQESTEQRRTANYE